MVRFTLIEYIDYFVIYKEEDRDIGHTWDEVCDKIRA
jgi:hypothetical protein